MVTASFVLPINGSLPSRFSFLCHNYHRSATILSWGFQRGLDGSSVTSRTKGHAFQLLANPNLSGKGDSKPVVIMVDPLEAKRLAAKQMQEIKAKEKFKRRRQIEAINGAWAIIGLTAGLVVEGYSGKSILDQVQALWAE